MKPQPKPKQRDPRTHAPSPLRMANNGSDSPPWELNSPMHASVTPQSMTDRNTGPEPTLELPLARSHAISRATPCRSGPGPTLELTLARSHAIGRAIPRRLGPGPTFELPLARSYAIGRAIPRRSGPGLTLEHGNTINPTTTHLNTTTPRPHVAPQRMRRKSPPQADERW